MLILWRLFNTKFLTEQYMKGEIVISEASRLKAEEVKRYIEKKYNLNKIKDQERTLNWKLFEEKVKQLNLSIEEKEQTKKNIIQQEMQELRKKRQKVSKKSFEPICVIGRGAFGEVRLCRQKKTNRIVAIKCLKKKQMIKKNQQVHLKAERNILADGGEWIVNLLYSFQDQSYLYLVMQYLAGGDLMNLLIARNVLMEEQAKFYAAEIVLAIEDIHKKNYIHRDLKPDNVLIDQRGHIKLSDFGLCKQTQTDSDGYLDEAIHDYVPGQIVNSNIDNFKKYLQKYKSNRNRKLAFSAVGTPDYIAPEMLKRIGYTQLVDWWALGVILYEMLVGYAPFSADNNDQIYYKIERYQQFLYFPPEVPISFEVIDLISRLLVDPRVRLGRNGADEIKNHPWFKDINWNEIKDMTPPFIPDLQSSIDTKYFDNYDESQPWLYQGDETYKKDFNFIGYTYKLQQQAPKNIIKEQLERVQKQKQGQRELERANMKKKNKIMVIGQGQGYHQRNVFQRLQINQNARLETQTERAKPRKSKSPLQPKDTNRLKTKQSTSKSPLKVESKPERPSGLPRKIAPLNLQGLTLTSTINHSGGQLSRTLTSRRSAKKNK